MQVLYDAGYVDRVRHRRSERRPTVQWPVGSLDHVLGQRRGDERGDRRRHLEHQLARVGGLPVQPLQLQRDALLRPDEPVRGLRPRPGDRRHRPRPPSATHDGDQPARHQRLPRPHRRQHRRRFAATVEQLRQQAATPNTLFLAAGDNIGASLFASVIQDDDPTHRRAQRARAWTSRPWATTSSTRATPTCATTSSRDVRLLAYLGANVYAKGTSTPVLDEYDTFEVGGDRRRRHRCGDRGDTVAGQPRRHRDLDFGDPVDAVNRVAAQLSTERGTVRPTSSSPVPRGRRRRHPEGATLEEEVAEGGEFKKIVNETTAEVDAIFTGHTHKQYAWKAPIPGQPEQGRPIVQTGQYGEYVGQVTLTVDPATGDVARLKTAQRRLGSAAPTSAPRVAEVEDESPRRARRAAVIGNEPVGRHPAAVTTAVLRCTVTTGRRVDARRPGRQRPASRRLRLRRARDRPDEPRRPPGRPPVRGTPRQPRQHQRRGHLRRGQRGAAVHEQPWRSRR